MTAIIRLSARGNMTAATTTVWLDDNTPVSFTGFQITGAKALTSIIDKMRQAGLKGMAWETLGDPKLKGVVPGRSFRRPRAKKSAQPRMFAGD